MEARAGINICAPCRIKYLNICILLGERWGHRLFSTSVRRHDALLIAPTQQQDSGFSAWQDSMFVEAQQDLKHFMDLRSLRLRVAAKTRAQNIPAQVCHPNEVKTTPCPLAAFSSEEHRPIKHQLFRQLVNDSIRSGGRERECGAIIRAQLDRCLIPRDILRVLVVAMQHRRSARSFLNQYEDIKAALYRTRQSVSDRLVSRTTLQILKRVEIAGYPIPATLLYTAAKFGSRSRDRVMMYQALLRVKAHVSTVNTNQFRSILAKISIGNGRLGEIRNGRWDREDLRQILLGFEEERHLPLDQKCHLGTFVDRLDWHHMHGWIAVLSTAGLVDHLWHEWHLWLNHNSMRPPRPSDIKAGRSLSKTGIEGDVWFIERMMETGDAKKAWSIYSQSPVPFHRLKAEVQFSLIRHHQPAGNSIIPAMDSLLVKYKDHLEAHGIDTTSTQPVATVDEQGCATIKEDVLRVTLQALRLDADAERIRLAQLYGPPPIRPYKRRKVPA